MQTKPDIMILASSFQFLSNNSNNYNAPIKLPPNKCVYHEPPPGSVADYSDNPTVYAKFLNGEVPIRTYAETAELLAVADPHPKAPLHAFVMPKRYIKDVYCLTPHDVDLVRDIHEMALEIVGERLPQALADEDYILCYHIPPFVSVGHLHLHVFAPASEMKFVHRYIKYACGTRLCIDDLELIERLERGETAVPYTYRPTYLEAMIWYWFPSLNKP